MNAVSRTFGTSPNSTTALKGANFSVTAGEMVAIMGPSGSGKSTLLTIAGGLDSPTSGTVEVNGIDMAGLSPTGVAEIRRKHIGFVFQGLNLLSGLNALENVSAPLELDGVPAKRARSEAKERLVEVGLADRLRAFPDDLSGGEQQRVAIARALVGDRRLLLADEPTGALDSTTGENIMRLIRDACSPSRCVVVVTHNEAVASLADRTVRLRDGAVEVSGS